jgi:ubiquitin-conjugating enzyme E2 Z
MAMLVFNNEVRSQSVRRPSVRSQFTDNKHKNKTFSLFKPVMENTKLTPENSGSEGAKDTTTVVIPRETVLRLLKDIRNVMTDTSLDTDGIMYKHSETDILTGYACIVGPSDGVYFGGYYFFEFKFPTNYPHSPPIVSYLTISGNMRFHPNYYANKKVCMSIINSWRGEQWTGCQSIRTILVTFQSILDKEPLLHEPGIKQQHNDFKAYHTMVEYKNYEFACMQLLTDLKSHVTIEYYSEFEEFMLRQFDKNKDKIRETIETRSKTVASQQYRISLYGCIICSVNYPALLNTYDCTFYPLMVSKLENLNKK